MHPGLRGPGHQPFQLFTAGDEHAALTGARQQRLHLCIRPHVVQDQQHAPVGEYVAIEEAAFLQLGGDLLARHTERAQKTAQDIADGQRVAALVTLQIREEASVRELVADAVGPVEGQPRLADAGCPGDQAHADRLPCALARHEGAQRGEFVHPPDESRDVGRQAGVDGRCPGLVFRGDEGDTGGRGQRGIVPQNCIVQFL